MSRLAALGRYITDVALPPQCMSCRGLVDQVGQLCPDCWSELLFIEGPACVACGLPFEFDLGDDAICGGCMRNAPDFDRARSALVYNDKSRDLILKFKHADRTEFAFAFANWVSRAGETELEECDAVAPVPLHWTKLFERRFNQSALLAKELGRRYAKPVELEILQRPKRGMSQGGLSRSARRKNVVGAFVVAKAESVKIEGKRIVLVDDVLTTGSTMNACARALKRAGARTVVGLTLARVVGPTGSPI